MDTVYGVKNTTNHRLIEGVREALSPTHRLVFIFNAKADVCPPETSSPNLWLFGVGVGGFIN